MWYLAIAMAISVLFSVVLYRVTTHELDWGLHRESQRITQQYPIFQNYSGIRPPGEYYQTSAHHILMQLVALNAVVLVTAGYLSYWLARRTLRPIEAAHEQQKRFTADVSHELRTPLTAIRMESEVALMNPKAAPKELRNTIQSNLEEVGKLESLINNLLRLTRLEADELQQHFEAVSSSAVVKAAVEQVQKQATERNITITQNTQTAIVSGDQDSLTQLLVILLDNAIKYSSDGSTVTVDVKPQKDHVLWQVKDTGTGIEKAALEHVFDRFYRANNARTKSEDETTGFGLGLSIADMIANLHHGHITLTSRPNHGTTATVSLPI